MGEIYALGVEEMAYQCWWRESEYATLECEKKKRNRRKGDNLNKQYKSPRKIQAPSNRFDTPIPKIQGWRLIDTTPESSFGTTTPATATSVTNIL